MTCFICKAADTTHQSIGDFHDRDCPACGRYLINKTLLGEMLKKNQAFDTERTRACINGFLKAGLQAVISRAEVAKYQLIASK